VAAKAQEFNTLLKRAVTTLKSALSICPNTRSRKAALGTPSQPTSRSTAPTGDGSASAAWPAATSPCGLTVSPRLGGPQLVAVKTGSGTPSEKLKQLAQAMGVKAGHLSRKAAALLRCKRPPVASSSPCNQEQPALWPLSTYPACTITNPATSFPPASDEACTPAPAITTTTATGISAADSHHAASTTVESNTGGW
jgi:hypothetical protein